MRQPSAFALVGRIWSALTGAGQAVMSCSTSILPPAFDTEMTEIMIVQGGWNGDEVVSYRQLVSWAEMKTGDVMNKKEWTPITRTK